MKGNHHSAREEFVSAYDKYVDELYRFILFKISDADLAWDLTQDTFLKTWQSIQEGTDVKNLRAFLYQAARNLVIDEYRRKSTDSLDNLQDAGFEPVYEEAGLSREEQDLFERAVERLHELDEIYREVTILRYVEGYGPKEIAEMLDLSENVVSVRINRAVSQLRELHPDQHDE